MDDEIFSDDMNPSIQAAQRLKEDGHWVDVTDRMSEVLAGIQKKYYDVYVLDIDMSYVKDDIENERGSSIGRVLRQCSSLTNIVVFSARGEIPDWFTQLTITFKDTCTKVKMEWKTFPDTIRNLAESPPVFPSFSLEKKDGSVFGDCVSAFQFGVNVLLFRKCRNGFWKNLKMPKFTNAHACRK